MDCRRCALSRVWMAKTFYRDAVQWKQYGHRLCPPYRPPAFYQSMSCINCMNTKLPMPPVKTQLISFGRALVDESLAIVSGKQPVSAEVQNERLSLCVACSQYDEGRCVLCGCNMVVKTGWRSTSCAATPPKWGPILFQADQPQTPPTTQ